MRKMFSFMKPYWASYVPGILLYSAQGFLFALVNAFFLNRITAAALNANIKGILLSVVFLIGMCVVYFPTIALGVILYNNSEMKAIRQLKKALFRQFVSTGPESAPDSHSGEGIAALNTDADTAASLYGNAISPLISCLTAIIFSALVVFIIDYRLGLASVAIGFAAFLIQYLFSKPLGKIGEQRLSTNAASVKVISDMFSGALAIRTLNAQQRMMIRFDRENTVLRALSIKQAYIAMGQDFFTTVQGWLTLTGVFTLGGYLVATGRLSFPLLMMVPSMCEALASGMSGIGGAWAAMQAPLAAGKRVTALLTPDEIKTPATLQTDNEGSHYDLHVSHLSFTYRSASEPALSDITFEVRENEMVALVGASGSGKSTLLRMLTGLYERDGVDLNLGSTHYDLQNLASWRSQFAYVDQSCKLFDMTVAENIALGRMLTKMAGLDKIRIQNAAAAAHADIFIQALPQGYDSPCGEKGASLSGGQKQRIAIARALYRNAPVLVFDEATSALDPESEMQVMETINSLRGSHTILFTSHHLNNVVNADRIIVMDQGRIVETGRHDDLLKANGLYSRLYKRE